MRNNLEQKTITVEPEDNWATVATDIAGALSQEGLQEVLIAVVVAVAVVGVVKVWIKR